MSTVEAPPPAPPPPAGVVEAGVDAAVVELSSLLPPQAARPRTAIAATASTAEVFFIRNTFLLDARGINPITPCARRRIGQSPWNSGVSPAKNAVTPRFRSFVPMLS